MKYGVAHQAAPKRSSIFQHLLAQVTEFINVYSEFFRSSVPTANISDDDEKLLPFGEASPGATGLELLLSLALKWAEETVEQPKARLSAAIACITINAARVAGLPAGQLRVGSPADLCIFNPDTRWLVQASALASQGKHTPFLGYELQGQVMHTIIAGRPVFHRA